MLNDILERINRRLDALQMTAAGASAAAGLSKDAIRNMQRSVEKGSEAGASTQTLLALAPVLKTTASWLLEGLGPEEVDEGNYPATINANARPQLVELTNQIDQIPISGKVAANSWLDVGDTAIDYDSIEYVPSLSGYPVAWQFAYRVDGNCLNKVAKHGSVLVCLNIIESGIEIADDDLVIVQRSRFNGQMIERTAKRVRQTSRGVELWPDSTDPAHQDPIALHDDTPGIDVQIIGKVLWILNRP